ncbi:hypothetical protein GCM10009555_082640 [Acrocarpospora macrocephala]|uniref:Calcium-binding protein n=1 Tax=Acrocarpospora macrocephala TaxID=150177 RepID=A0A5M3WXH9_9ACTN|nr:hypothetical protein [Acrocarpospora macrocephala]GES10848.1 hypothetical protein Amac_044450 [Acrocarpospora macrocephala]
MNISMSAKRALALSVGLLALPLTVLSATPAHATTGVSLAGGGKLIVSASDVDNDVTVSVDGRFIVVRNSKDNLTANSGCVKLDANTVRCPGEGITNLQISTGNGSDRVANETALPSKVFLNGSVDIFFGGSARDTVFGDDGTDFIFGNGGSDILVGGAGNDSANGNDGTDFCSAESETNCEGDA